MSLRDLPSVDSLLSETAAEEFVQTYGRSLTVDAIRRSIDSAREGVRDGGNVPDGAALLEQAGSYLEAWLRPTLVPVINATGVIIHTNLGRAPLSIAARAAIASIGEGYSNLEYDVEAGTRGKRDRHAEELLERLTGAEAAMVVNNNAAAVLLVLTALASDREVVVSRTQLIEIGGGFRIPDIMEQSGARLREVGTTNRTHLRDFEKVIGDSTGLILRAHHSNFKIIGFSTEPSLSDLVGLAQTHDLPMLDDLGSGALLDTADFGLGHEPMVQESILEGAPLVAFSGDKLVGGPQAGILVGQRALIQQLKAHPMARAVRPDKFCLAGLAATLGHYLAGEAETGVPIWQMISASQEELHVRAADWQARLNSGELIEGRSTVGGGSLPEETLPTTLLGRDLPHPNQVADRLRQLDPPVVARVDEDRVLLDPRTVLPDQEAALISGLETVLKENEN